MPHPANDRPRKNKATARATPSDATADDGALGVSFTFEDRPLFGLAGESIAKALYHNDIQTLSRSVKYGRPRGVSCARGRCVACHVEVDGNSGVKACVTPLRSGMRIRRQDRKPIYGGLLMAAARRFSFPAGFYFRMFTRPAWLRRLFLGTLRRMAGVGRVPSEGSAGARAEGTSGGARSAAAPLAGPLSTIDTRYDVIVVGAGISGMAAAAAASRNGARVLLVDEYASPGGHSLGEDHDDGRARARQRLTAATSTDERIQCAFGVSAAGYYPGGRIVLSLAPGREDGRALVETTGKSIILAVGAYDQIPLFPNNDLPGVLGHRAARLLLDRDGWLPGRRAIVFGDGDPLSRTLALLRRHNVAVAALATTGAGAEIGTSDIRHVRRARLAGANGRRRVSSVWVETPARTGSKATGEKRCRIRLDGDLLCLALPGQPVFELPYQAGFRYRLDGAPNDYSRRMLPETTVLHDEDEPDRYLIGEASGARDWRAALESATGVARRATETLT